MELVKFFMGGKGKEHAAALKEVEAAVRKLAKVSVPPGKLSMGDKVAEVERAIDRYLGVEEGSSLFVSNCTAALELGYRYAGIGPGDEVIVPTNTFIATVAYPLSVGAKLVFADVDPKTVNMDPEDVAKKITKKTKIIVPVHIGGYPCDMDAIMKLAKKHDLVVMEDAAHGFGGEYKGRKLGTIGHFGCYSFHEVKNCTSFGEGGVFVSNVKAYRSEARRARFLGVDFSSKIKNWLYNISLIKGKNGVAYQASNNASVTEIQAIGLMQQLKRYDKILKERKREATYMTKRLTGVPGIIPQALGDKDNVPTFHLYQLQIDPKTAGGDVQTLKAKLEQKGVTNIPHFGPVYRFAASVGSGFDEKKIAQTCPVTEHVFDKCYTHLPIYGLTKEQLKYMADAIIESVAEMRAGR
jgi:dTDP-4-amino-4,6-dideoxygalactose transaminase